MPLDVSNSGLAVRELPAQRDGQIFIEQSIAEQNHRPQILLAP